jgi:hypothetical protein
LSLIAAGPIITKFANSRSNRDLATRLLKCFQEFRYGLPIAVPQGAVSEQSRSKPNALREGNSMSTDEKLAKRVIQDKLESQVGTAEAKAD